MPYFFESLSNILKDCEAKCLFFQGIFDDIYDYVSLVHGRVFFFLSQTFNITGNNEMSLYDVTSRGSLLHNNPKSLLRTVWKHAFVVVFSQLLQFGFNSNAVLFHTYLISDSMFVIIVSYLVVIVLYQGTYDHYYSYC